MSSPTNECMEIGIFQPHFLIYINLSLTFPFQCSVMSPIQVGAGLFHSLKMGHFEKQVIDNSVKIIFRAFSPLKKTVHSEFIPADTTINLTFLPRRPKVIEGGNYMRSGKVKNCSSHDHTPLECVTNHVQSLVNK